jgi:hypothetical protein
MGGDFLSYGSALDFECIINPPISFEGDLVSLAKANHNLLDMNRSGIDGSMPLGD